MDHFKGRIDFYKIAPPPFLSSGPDRGESPVEWGKIPSVRPSVRPPPAGPQTLLARPQTPAAGPQTPQPALRPLQQVLKPLQQALKPLQQALRPLRQALRPLLQALRV